MRFAIQIAIVLVICAVVGSVDSYGQVPKGSDQWSFCDEKPFNPQFTPKGYAGETVFLSIEEDEPIPEAIEKAKKKALANITDNRACLGRSEQECNRIKRMVIPWRPGVSKDRRIVCFQAILEYEIIETPADLFDEALSLTSGNRAVIQNLMRFLGKKDRKTIHIRFAHDTDYHQCLSSVESTLKQRLLAALYDTEIQNSDTIEKSDAVITGHLNYGTNGNIEVQYSFERPNNLVQSKSLMRSPISFSPELFGFSGQELKTCIYPPWYEDPFYWLVGGGLILSGVAAFVICNPKGPESDAEEDSSKQWRCAGQNEDRVSQNLNQLGFRLKFGF